MSDDFSVTNNTPLPPRDKHAHLLIKGIIVFIVLSFLITLGILFFRVTTEDALAPASLAPASVETPVVIEEEKPACVRKTFSSTPKYDERFNESILCKDMLWQESVTMDTFEWMRQVGTVSKEDMSNEEAQNFVIAVRDAVKSGTQHTSGRIGILGWDVRLSGISGSSCEISLDVNIYCEAEN